MSTATETAPLSFDPAAATPRLFERWFEDCINVPPAGEHNYLDTISSSSGPYPWSQIVPSLDELAASFIWWLRENVEHPSDLDYQLGARLGEMLKSRGFYVSRPKTRTTGTRSGADDCILTKTRGRFVGGLRIRDEIVSQFSAGLAGWWRECVTVIPVDYESERGDLPVKVRPLSAGDVAASIQSYAESHNVEYPQTPHELEIFLRDRGCRVASTYYRLARESGSKIEAVFGMRLGATAS